MTTDAVVLYRLDSMRGADGVRELELLLLLLQHTIHMRPRKI